MPVALRLFNFSGLNASILAPVQPLGRSAGVPEADDGPMKRPTHDLN